MKKSLVIISCLLMVAGCARNDRYMGGGGPSPEAADNPTKGAGARALKGDTADSSMPYQDSSFLREAAQAGLAEVQMGQLVAQRAQNSAFKDFGQRLVADHTKANEELMQLAARKGFQLPTSINATESQMIQRLSNLSGPEFDRVSGQDAIEAHKKAIRLFRQAAQQSQDPDIKAFAQKTLPTLEEHLKMAQQFGTTGSSTEPSGTTEQK